jgi:polyisoprenoid-binding protein YceI
MTRLTKTILIGALAAFAVLPFVGGLPSIPAANAETGEVARETNDNKLKKVSYLPVTGGDYSIDKNHSVIGFTIRHNELTLVGGRFKDFTGTIHFDDKDVTKSSVEFQAKVESIDTGVAARDNHLRTADFFEVAKYPEMTFTSKKVERKGKGYVLTGDLSLKGVTKQVMLPFTITGAIKDGRGNTRIGIAAQTTIDRRDYGITWGHALPGGGFDVAHDVTIDLHLEAIQPAPAAPKPAG